jgi:hypothetical protein
VTRKAWKLFYRQFRILRREQHKAFLDMMCFGTGFVRIKDGFVNYVLPEAVLIDNISD